ncbi:MAG: metallophosphoesterase [Nitrososphaerota archaeon]|nr:metallophosphoesterase [Nitrososphaerota archaeon]
MVKTRLFFVTDVHGSDRCFRKFVNAGKFYNASILILGGDITGKMIVPVVKQPDGNYKSEFGGTAYVVKSPEQLADVVKNIKDSGFYPYLSEPKDVEELSAKPELVNQLFKKLMKESIEGWMRLAEERLKGTGIKCYVSPGNDDFFEIDEALDSATYVINPEEKTVDIDGEHEMITLGYANHTPWNSPREVDEEVLQQKIDKMASQIKDMKTALFNLHVPPINTVIDQAPKLDETLKPVISGGSIVMTSAGSTAVRASIEKYQPLAGIHGHIHESRGMVKIGRTVCFNPGSEYNSGILKGLLCDLDKDKVKSYMLTSG